MAGVIVRVLPLVFILFALLCIVVAAVMPISSAKGKTRLAGSLSVCLAFVLGALFQITHEGHLWPGIVGLLAGAFLAWAGLRKFRRVLRVQHQLQGCSDAHQPIRKDPKLSYRWGTFRPSKDGNESAFRMGVKLPVPKTFGSPSSASVSRHIRPPPFPEQTPVNDILISPTGRRILDSSRALVLSGRIGELRPFIVGFGN
jgi:hypothetical protein